MKGDRKANRRIRLLLAVFVLVFAGTLARAAWLQGVSSASLGRMAQRQHRESIQIPAGRGTIYDRTGVQLAIGEQTTTIYADPRELTEPRKIAVAAHKLLGVNANQLYPQLLNRKIGFVYVARFADPKAAATFLNAQVHRRQLVPGGEAGLPAGHGRLAAGRLRRHRQQGPRRPGGPVRQGPRGQDGRADDRSRPVRTRDRRDQLDRGARRQRRLHDHRPHDPGERRDGAPPDRRALGREGRDGGRPRPAHRSGARDGAGAGLRREPGERRPVRRAAEPCRHRHVRARLDLQARHDRGRSLRRARRAGHDVQAALLDPRRRPGRARCRAARHRDAVGRADPLALVERRGGDDRREARLDRARRLDRASSASARRPVSTSRARAPGRSCRSTAGRARRSATCRSARESR